MLTPYKFLTSFLSNQKQNITDAALHLMASSLLHIFFFVTDIIYWYLSLSPYFSYKFIPNDLCNNGALSWFDPHTEETKTNK